MLNGSTSLDSRVTLGVYGMGNTVCNRLLVTYYRSNVCQVKHSFTVPLSLVLVCGRLLESSGQFGGVVLWLS
jgi:hypothetical protein